MLSRALLWLRSLSVGGGLLLLALFPLPATLWSLAGVLDPEIAARWPLLSVALDNLDAGGQQPLARSLLRAVCAGLAMAGLFLPSCPHWRRPPWLAYGIPLLALGAVSSLLCPHRFQALREWETWGLAAGVVYTVASQWRPRWGYLALGWVYSLVVLVLVQAVSVGIPGGSARLGGPFHHPNAFSTFCLMALAVTLSRSFLASPERHLAQAVSGAWLGLALCAGSLTGGCLLVGGTAFLATQTRSRRAAPAWAILAATTLIALNLSGGWRALLALPLMLVALWLLAMHLRAGEPVVANTWLIALSAALVLTVNSLLAPGQVLEGASTARSSSGQGRLQLYRSALAMAAEHPLLGVGPGGFSREFPARQTSLGVYSKFPHSLPLELASEWGLPAAALAVLMLAGALRESFSSPLPQASISGRVLMVFLLHSSTDVQTQFPYLLVLAAVALGLMGARREPEERPESTTTLLCRTALSLSCLALLVMSLSRLGAGFDRALATAIAQKGRSPAAGEAVSHLLESSFTSDPLDSESARLWGMALEDSGQSQAAREIAALAVELDPRRASCRLFLLTVAPPPPQDALARYQQAVALDPINYPTFYRWWAETLWSQSQPEQALAVLRGQAKTYDQKRLDELFSFRESDLEDQLVEFHALKAALEEWQQAGAGEPDWRLALLHCQDKGVRRARLRRYLTLLRGGPVDATLAHRLQLLLDQIPSQDTPGAVDAAADKP